LFHWNRDGIIINKLTELEIDHLEEETKGGRKEGDRAVLGRVPAATRSLSQQLDDPTTKTGRKTVTEIGSEVLGQDRGELLSTILEKEGRDMVRASGRIFEGFKSLHDFISGNKGIGAGIWGRKRVQEAGLVTIGFKQLHIEINCFSGVEGGGGGW